MKSILKNYHEFLTTGNPDSMISKILGIHKVIFYKKKHQPSHKSYFCIMDNVFCTKQKIDLRYDLKGSTYGRRTITDPSKKHDHTIALKDVDFIDNKAKFRVGESNRKRILEVIRKDCDFFIQNNIIDYSLLVGISNKTDPSQSIVSQRDNRPAAVPQHDNSPCYTLNNSMVSVTDDKKFY